MSLPEGYLPREGDVLIVHATVRFTVDDDEDRVHLSPMGAEYSHFRIPIAVVVGLFAKAWEAGEAVRNTNDYDNFGDVIAVCGDKVWVKTSKGAMVTFDANALEPLPEVDPEQARMRSEHEDMVHAGLVAQPPFTIADYMKCDRCGGKYATNGRPAECQGAPASVDCAFNLSRAHLREKEIKAAALDAELAQSRAEEVARAGAAGGDDDVKF